jgi:hypothetical protein
MLTVHTHEENFLSYCTDLGLLPDRLCTVQFLLWNALTAMVGKNETAAVLLFVSFVLVNKYFSFINAFHAGGVTQVAEHLPSKCEALS